MMDDGVAIKVLNNIEKSVFSIDKNIEVIYGETDFVYCLNKVSDGDCIIIIDSSYFELEPGTITLKNLNKFDCKLVRPSSQHQISFIDMIKDYKNNIEAYFIAIEILKVDFGASFSNEINSMFEHICREVLDKIKYIVASK